MKGFGWLRWDQKGGRRHSNLQRERVDFQVSVLSAIIVIISCYLIFFFNYYFSYNSMIRELRDRAFDIHDYLEERLDNASFSELNQKEDNKTELYQECKSMLENVRRAAGVRYLYTAKRTDSGEMIYLVDGLPADSEDFRYIGDAIEPECIPDLEKALEGNNVLPLKIKKTSWGPVFISYFPMHYEDQVTGVLGIEFDAESQYLTFRNMALITPAIIIVFCIVSGAISVILFRRISNPFYHDLANTDFLTGLKNRNAFEVDLNNLDKSLRRAGLAMVSIDLDRLKQVNDTLGHATGDQYIRTCAVLLQTCLNKEGSLYRIGGDEFCVILKQKDEEYVKKLLETVTEQVEKAGGDVLFEMGISLGYAFYDSHRDATLFDTLKRADDMMYEVKKERKSAGRGKRRENGDII